MGDSIASDYNNAWQNIVIARTGMTLTTQDARPGRTLLETFECWGASLGGVPGTFRKSGGWACGLMTGFTEGEVFAKSLANIDVLIIALGTNGENTPIGTLGDSTATQTFYGELRWVVETYQTAKPAMRVILVTPQRNGFAAPEVTGAIADAFTHYGKSVGVPVINMFALGGVNEKTSGTLTLDGTHPSPLGFSNFYGPVIAQGVVNVN